MLVDWRYMELADEYVRLSQHCHLLVITIFWILLANLPRNQERSERKHWESACWDQRNFPLLSARGQEGQEIRQHAELYNH